MNANELRIGNRVLTFGTNGNPDGWEEIDVSAQNILTCENHPEWFKPIELTEERLVNLGFIEEKDYWYHNQYSNFILFKNEYGLVFKYGGSVMNRCLYYVHELQNAFQFCGDELTISKN